MSAASPGAREPVDPSAASGRRLAGVLAQAALTAVFEPALVSTLRADSPLAALGWTDADAVCVADAVSGTAAQRGVRCVLGDSAFVGVVTVGGLVDAIEVRLQDGDRDAH